MRGLTAREVLRVWEIGQPQIPAERALTLLETACPETSRAELEVMNIGTRDALLLSFRERLFGSNFYGTTRCPQCRASVELGFSVSEVRTDSPKGLSEPFRLAFGDYEFKCRLPNSLDLLEVRRERDPDKIARVLFERCLIEKRRRGADVSIESLPAEVTDAIVTEIAQRDPQADICFNLICPDCAHRWEAIFDIVSFAWNEIGAWAARLLRQVHTLALAYGWRETDILSLSPARRQIYLEMLSE